MALVLDFLSNQCRLELLQDTKIWSLSYEQSGWHILILNELELTFDWFKDCDAQN